MTKPFNRMIILADDLTGANDTAIQFVNQGLSALVITDTKFSDPAAFANYDVISINSDSRGMSAGDAYNTVRDLVVRLGSNQGGDVFYKKIDSVLRGNPAKELAAVMDELDIPLALVAPSFPANQSILEHGMLNSGSGVIDAVKVFAGGMDQRVDSVPLEEIRRGPQVAAEYILSRHADGVKVFVADALTDTDLEEIYRTAATLKKQAVLAGAAALANQVAKSMGREKPWKSPQFLTKRSNSPALILAGTRQGETAAQITTLSRILSVPIIRFRVDLVKQGKCEDAILNAYRAAVEYMAQKPELCIIAVESMFKSEIPTGNVDRNNDGDSDSSAISGALGALAGKLLDTFQFQVMITTGGDTSLGVCQQLGIKGIQPLAEICPGIPIGRITGGTYDGRFIITKSGRFGNSGSLLEIMSYLNIIRRSDE
ncbi:four-carbon acid sugar kinase family protein [Treponema primitia]|uniref:four-carbon acid sugar kinase family protein n=1 Tax=Treponema primitia TaxID=88058 RepID=UPI000255573C|nr:type III effector Hrp-dependent outer protein [Treponema primitia]